MTSSSKVLISPAPIRTPVGGKTGEIHKALPSRMSAAPGSSSLS